MGRPRKSEPRSCQFNLCLTATELDSIQRRARALGMRPVHFGRAILLDEKRAPAPNVKAAAHHSKLAYHQLARLGNNLNQLVRHLHETGDPLPADLEPLLADIRALIARGDGHDR